MKFPQELTDSLAALSYIHLSKVPYDTKVPALRRESQKIMALRDWAESHTEPIDGWMELYFSYLERMAIDIDPVRDSWTAYYELKGILRSLLFTMMCRQKQTRGSVLEFGKNLNDRLLLHRHGALISGHVMDMLVDYPDPIKINFGLHDEAADAMYEVYALWIDTLFELASKATSATQVHRLRMAVYHLEVEMTNLKYKKENWAQIEALMNRILLFQLSVFDALAFTNQEDFIKKIYNGPLGEIALPEAGKLLDEGVQLFDANRKEAILLMLLHNVLTALNVAAGNSDDIRSYHSQGGNIGNVEGVSAFEKFLGMLCIYTNEAGLIANYLKQYISTNDQLFVIASVMEQDAYGVPSESENVKHRIVLALVDPHSESPQQIALKKLCIRWGLLDKYALPEKYRFNVPKKLPSTVQELVMFYKELKITNVFRMGKRAPENSVPENFPDDIRKIYLSFNGTPDDRHFANLSDLQAIHRDIMETYGSHLEDDYDEEPGTDDNRVDIRKHIHTGIIPIGKNYSGDSYFADPKHLSVTGYPVIIEYMHDEYLTGKLVANSLAEFLGRRMIVRFTEMNGNEKQLTALLDTPITIHPHNESLVSRDNPLEKLISRGERYNSTDNEYFASSTRKLLLHSFSMFGEISYERKEQFVIPEPYVEFLQMLDNDTLAPLPGQELYIYGFYGMVTHTFDYFDSEGDLGDAPAFWLAVGHRNDRGNFFLCCDKASGLYGKVGEFYDSTPFRDEDDFCDIGTDFPDFCKNVMDGKVY